MWPVHEGFILIGGDRGLLPRAQTRRFSVTGRGSTTTAGGGNRVSLTAAPRAPVSPQRWEGSRAAAPWHADDDGTATRFLRGIRSSSPPPRASLAAAVEAATKGGGSHHHHQHPEAAALFQDEQGFRLRPTHVVKGRVRRAIDSYHVRGVTYLRVLSMLLYLAFFLAVLLLQGDPHTDHHAVTAINAIFMPGGALTGATFRDKSGVEGWLRSQVVASIWQPHVCGDGVCESPLEFPAFGGRFGCLTDCGLEERLTDVFVQVDHDFSGKGLASPKAAAQLVSWNVCLRDEERAALGYSDLCWCARGSAGAGYSRGDERADLLGCESSSMQRTVVAAAAAAHPRSSHHTHARPAAAGSRTTKPLSPT